MKIMSFLGLAVAAALMFAVPASAAAMPEFEPGVVISPAQLWDDCVVSAGVDQAIHFVEAKQDCDATLAELTGLCLVETTEPMPARVAAVFAPDFDLTCTAIRPSPPG